MNIKGIKYIGPVFDNCYDNKTELLTNSGWKFFKDITLNDAVCTLNDNQCIEYHKPINLINKEYNGIMYHYNSSRSKIDLLVTPNHNMYVQTEASRKADRIHKLYMDTYGVKKLSGSNWKFESAESIINKNRYFKKNANYVVEDVKVYNLFDNELLMDDWLEFLGYYISEGSSTITKNKHYIVQIRQFGKDLIKMSTALSKITRNKINIREGDGRVIVNDKKLCLFLKSTLGNVYKKHIPRYILNNCSKRQLTILFEALMLGDGHDLRNNYAEGIVSGGSSYHTASKQLKDDFMELLLKIGYSGTSIITNKKGDKIFIYDRECTVGEDNWTIQVRFNNNVCAKNNKTKFYVDTINYNGTIHCVTVKNHTLYIRRNGCVVWSGNSGYAQANRGNILALNSLNIPVTISPISFENARPDLSDNGKILNSLVDRDIDYNVVIIHTTPEFWEKYAEYGKTNIGYTIWETTKLHKDWPGYINNNVEKVLVGCEWNKQVFKDSGVTIPIGVVPHGIDDKYFNKIDPYNIEGIDKDTFVFYNISQWCYDDKTRVLTDKGFKYFKDLKYEDEVATINPKTEELEYQKPEKIVKFRRKDKMLKVKGIYFDLCVTPDHKMLTKEGRKGTWELIPFNTLIAKGKQGQNIVPEKYKFKKNCKWVGNEVEYFDVPMIESITPMRDGFPKKIKMNLFLEFLGWYLSEGSSYCGKRNYEVTITQLKAKYIDEIHDCIKEMGYNTFTRSKKDIVFNSRELYYYVKQFGKCYEKYIPNFVKKLSSRQIKILLTSLFKGDGSLYENGDWVKYTTTSRRLAEDVQECLLKIGMSGAISTEDPTLKKKGTIDGRIISGVRLQYIISVNRERNEPSMYYADLKEIDYDGYIYCATVPNHTMLVERNGKVIFSGNTERKHPIANIKAYWHTFQNNENVALVLKTYRSDYSENEKNAIRNTIQRLKQVAPFPVYPKIYLILDMLSNDEIMSLHARGDCYLSLDRFEGFGLPHFESGASGNPIIVTGGGGVTEYAKEDNSYLVNYNLTPVFGMPYSNWYSGNQLWAEPDIKHGSDLMKHVYNNRDDAKERGLRLQQYIKDNFSWEDIGKKIIKEIEDL